MAVDLDSVIEAAMADLTPPDAEPPAPEGAPDEQTEADDLEAIEAAVEDSEAEDDPDGDGTPDDESDGDGDDEDADDTDDEDEDSPDALTLADEATVTLSDGTTLTGQELREGYLRQSDYTRKTQELADQRKHVDETFSSMETWFAERQENPDAWAWEVVTEYATDPAKALAGAISMAPDPTGVLAWTIRNLAETGKLNDEFVRLVGLEEVAAMAASAEGDNRVSQLERKVDQERAERERLQAEQAEQARRAALLDQVDRQWQTVKEAEGLTFDSEQSEADAKIALLRYASENGVGNLETAFAAMAHRGIAPKGAAPAAHAPASPTKADAAAALERKRKTSAITRKPSGGSAAKPQRRGLDDAIKGAASDLGLKF